MIIKRSGHPSYKKDHVAIMGIGTSREGWMRIGCTGIRISHLDENVLNIIGVDLI
jgi:hypothetical protein